MRAIRPWIAGNRYRCGARFITAPASSSPASLLPLAAGNFVYKASEGDPWVPIFPVLLAIAIFLIGRALRFVLSTRLD